jgi:hypothetical protein
MAVDADVMTLNDVQTFQGNEVGRNGSSAKSCNLPSCNFANTRSSYPVNTAVIMRAAAAGPNSSPYAECKKKKLLPPLKKG